MLLYSTLGAEWAHLERVTYSFAPDGTSIGGQPSAWYSTMQNRGIAETTWKDQFRRAAASWQLYTNINLVEVPDDGSAFSVSGNQQGDSRFGDIRIGATELDASALSLTFLPPPDNGGTLAGDIVMNSTSVWSINGTYDVMTVAVHELGHALGLGHSALTSAVMYTTYTGIKQAMTTDDISGIQAVYGTRPADAFEGSSNNNAYTRASTLNNLIDSRKQVRISSLDIGAATDYDWYRVTIPAGASSTMTVSVQSTGLSSLRPRVSVLNSSLVTLANYAAPSGYGTTATVSVSGVVPGQTYYIRAMAAVSGPAGNGGYGLLVNLGSQSISPISPPDTTVPEQPDQGGGSINFNPGKDSKGGSKGDVVRVGKLRGHGHYFEIDPDFGSSASGLLVPTIVNDRGHMVLIPIDASSGLTNVDPFDLDGDREKGASSSSARSSGRASV
jgi:hypothetical protein